jgi:hypothetical protein
MCAVYKINCYRVLGPIFPIGNPTAVVSMAIAMVALE